MNDCISRQEAIRLVHSVLYEMRVDAAATEIEKPMSKEDKLLLRIDKVVCAKLKELSSVQPNNQINLCDSCDYSYPDCPSKNDDVIFGNGIGNDNICACNKYKPSAEPVRMKGKWCVTPDGRLVCSRCYETPTNRIIVDGNLIYDMTPIRELMKFCPNCGASMLEGE